MRANLSDRWRPPRHEKCSLGSRLVVGILGIANLRMGRVGVRNIFVYIVLLREIWAMFPTPESPTAEKVLYTNVTIPCLFSPSLCQRCWFVFSIFSNTTRDTT